MVGNTYIIFCSLVESFGNTHIYIYIYMIEKTASRRLLRVISGMFNGKPGINILANVCFN